MWRAEKDKFGRPYWFLTDSMRRFMVGTDEYDVVVWESESEAQEAAIKVNAGKPITTGVTWRHLCDRKAKEFSDVVGDITSDEKGSGARYNSGKPPLELIPLNILARAAREYYAHDYDRREHAYDIADIFDRLYEFQRTKKFEPLYLIFLSEGENGIEECARVFGYGRDKYAAWNWAKGMDWSIPLGCAARHLLKMLIGEENDRESGLPHRGHVLCNVVMLITFIATYPEGNDLPPGDRI